MILVREIFSYLDVIGLGMLLGGAMYESVVMAPNYRSNVPLSLEYVRNFMKVRTPANYFRVFSPVTILALIVTIILSWNVQSARWWFAGALIGQFATDSITYIFHYPRNKILFIDELNSDDSNLERVAIEWGKGNIIRVSLLILVNICGICGLISIIK